MKLRYKTSRANRFVDEGTQTNQEIDLADQDNSVQSVHSAPSIRSENAEFNPNKRELDARRTTQEIQTSKRTNWNGPYGPREYTE